MPSHIRVFPQGEIGILVADLEGDAPPQAILDALQQAAHKIPGVRVAALGGPLTSREEARSLGDRYHATMVVYGRSAPEQVTVSYVITPRFSEVRTLLEGDFPVSAADIEHFDAFLAAGLDAPYILGITAGQLWYFSGDHEAALAAFSVAIHSLNPARLDVLKAADLHFYRGNVYGRLGGYEPAIAEYNRAIALNPLFAEACMNRALAWVNLGKFAEALDDFGRVIDLAPDDPDAYYRRGTIQGRLGAYDAAVADFSRVIELTPRKVLPLVNRAMAYMGLNKHEAALADLNRAIALDPDYAPAYASRGHIYGALEAYAQAVEDFDTASRLNPQDAQALYGRGEAYYFLGDFDRAVADFTRTVELAPGYALAYLGRGGAHEKLGEIRRAAADFWQYVQLNQQDVIRRESVTGEVAFRIDMTQGRAYAIPLALTTGQPVTIRATRVSDGDVDPLVVLLDADGTPLIGNDDFTDWNAAIHDFVPPHSGTYTMIVTHAAGGADGQIEVVVHFGALQ